MIEIYLVLTALAVLGIFLVLLTHALFAIVQAIREILI